MIKNISKKAPLYLFNFQLKNILTSSNNYYNSLYFIIMVFVVFHISWWGLKTIHLSSVIGITITTLILSLILISNTIFKNDKKEGLLELIYLSGLNLYWYLIVKFLIVVLMSSITAIATLIISYLMFNVKELIEAKAFLAILISIPPIAVVLLFISIITLNINDKIMSYLLSLPLIIPVLIFTIGAIEIEYKYIFITIGLNFIYIPLFIYFSRRTIDYISF